MNRHLTVLEMQLGDAVVNQASLSLHRGLHTDSSLAKSPIYRISTPNLNVAFVLRELPLDLWTQDVDI